MVSNSSSVRSVRHQDYQGGKADGGYLQKAGRVREVATYTRYIATSNPELTHYQAIFGNNSTTSTTSTGLCNTEDEVWAKTIYTVFGMGSSDGLSEARSSSW